MRRLSGLLSLLSVLVSCNSGRMKPVSQRSAETSCMPEAEAAITTIAQLLAAIERRKQSDPNLSYTRITEMIEYEEIAQGSGALDNLTNLFRKIYDARDSEAVNQHAKAEFIHTQLQCVQAKYQDLARAENGVGVQGTLINAWYLIGAAGIEQAYLGSKVAASARAAMAIRSLNSMLATTQAEFYALSARLNAINAIKETAWRTYSAMTEQVIQRSGDLWASGRFAEINAIRLQMWEQFLQTAGLAGETLNEAVSAGEMTAALQGEIQAIRTASAFNPYTVAITAASLAGWLSVENLFMFDKAWNNGYYSTNLVNAYCSGLGYSNCDGVSNNQQDARLTAATFLKRIILASQKTLADAPSDDEVAADFEGTTNGDESGSGDTAVDGDQTGDQNVAAGVQCGDVTCYPAQFCDESQDAPICVTPGDLG